MYKRSLYELSEAVDCLAQEEMNNGWNRMKILVVCQHYAPEPFRITEICEDLVNRGHEVVAVVGLPNYPSGIVPKEYRWFQRRRERIHGVEVRRCYEIGRRNTKLGLAVNYVSYMVSASWKALWMRRDYDVIYAYSTSPVLMSLPAALLRCFTRKKLVIYVLDIWPACLAAMGVYDGSILYAFMKRVSKWVYRKADLLLISSKRFRQYLSTVHGIDVLQENYLPQFADAPFDSLPQKTSHETLRLVFAGNIGRVQGVQTLLHSANILRDEDIHWYFLGDGSDYKACVALMKELHLEEKVTFYGRRPLMEMPSFYAMADAMLVSMRDDISVNDTLPGKVQSYMAAGKPILGSIAGETADIVREAACGLCAPPEEPQAFAQVVREFKASPQKEQMGKNAKAYSDMHFSKKRHMDKLETLLFSMTCKEG